VKQALQLQEKAGALRLRDAVMDSELEAQTAVAPFLRNRVLRRVIQTFANDPAGDFSKWATNPRVIDMLAQAQRLMEEGRLAEGEAEEFMLRALRDPAGEHHAEFAAKSRQVARLPTDQLVEALNEHVSRAGQGCMLAGLAHRAKPASLSAEPLREGGSQRIACLPGGACPYGPWPPLLPNRMARS
jgi:hypothetical protein